MVEIPVGGQEYGVLPLRKVENRRISHAFVFCSADINYRMSRAFENLYGGPGKIFIQKKNHCGETS